MAELAVFNIAKSLLPQLSSLAKDELFLWYNSKTELEKLENTINTIKGVLFDAEQRQATDTAVQQWLLRLRDEMYKADDLFDSISTIALRKRVMSGNKILKQTRLFFSKSNRLVFDVSTAHKVKEIGERLDCIAKDINQFGFIRRVDERPLIKTKPQSHSYIREDQVIGREKEKEEILGLLFKDPNGEQSVSVIAVVGIGGLGKTALSQLVYNAKKVEDFFELQMWACVNYFTNLKETLEGVMSVKTSMSLDKLQNMLRKKIRGKRFLLVLDDVWDDIREHWLRLKELLDAGDRGSKVLMTTRSKTVAQNLSTLTPYYTLRGLSDEHAWSLFTKMAFDNNQEDGYQAKAKEVLGREIVKKCANVPLAIRTIGSYLYKKDMKQWLELVDNQVMNEMHDHPEKMIMEVLKISYDDLPYSLKHCFVHCSLFPEDYKFDKMTLIHLWMAQGLLQSSDKNDCLEDVGERYFQYLTERCFFQNIREHDDGRVSCKMHDLFHSLAVKISGKECAAVKKLEKNMKGKFARHLLVMDIEGVPLQGEGIRSLVSLAVGLVERSVLGGLFMNFTSLRTLSLQQLDTKEIPSSIGKLVHLRYLDLRMSENMKRLPATLCKLQNLLILRLGGCSNLTRLPDDLRKLISLRYLEIEGCDELDHMPSGLEEMTSLVMLDRLIVNEDHGGLKCLTNLNNLTGALHIELPIGLWKNCVADAEESMLSCKTKLSRLVITFVHSGTIEEVVEADVVLHRLQPPHNISHLCVEFFPGVKFPDWLSSLTNLVDLDLNRCYSCLELPHLNLLCQLKRLNIYYLPRLKYIANDICYDGGDGSFFPSLESLSIDAMPCLKGWWRPMAEGSYANQLCFSRLSELAVSDCPQLTCLPGCPSLNILSLCKVNVKLVTQLVRVPETNPPSSSSLQTCSTPDDELKLVPALRELTITNCSNFNRQSLFRSLQYMSSLESLSFMGSFVREIYKDENWEKEGMPWMSLTRLKSLHFTFGNDPQGAHLLNGLHYLTLLEELSIHQFVPDDINVQWTALPNIKVLHIHGMIEVGFLNTALQQLKKLQTLAFRLCFLFEEEWNELSWEDLKGLRNLRFSSCSMKSLPEKCRHLRALEDLEIIECDELTCLPTWVSQLTSLKISEPSPALKEECRKPVGSYWPLIRDIPDLTISSRDADKKKKKVGSSPASPCRKLAPSFLLGHSYLR